VVAKKLGGERRGSRKERTGKGKEKGRKMGRVWRLHDRQSQSVRVLKSNRGKTEPESLRAKDGWKRIIKGKSKKSDHRGKRTERSFKTGKGCGKKTRNGTPLVERGDGYGNGAEGFLGTVQKKKRLRRKQERQSGEGGGKRWVAWTKESHEGAACGERNKE